MLLGTKNGTTGSVRTVSLMRVQPAFILLQACSCSGTLSLQSVMRESTFCVMEPSLFGTFRMV